VFAFPATGTYSPLQTLLLDLSGPLAGEVRGEGNIVKGGGKRKERKRKGGMGKGGVTLGPRKKS